MKTGREGEAIGWVVTVTGVGQAVRATWCPGGGDVQRAHLLTPQAGMRDAGCGQPAPSWMRDQKSVSEEGIKLDLFFFLMFYITFF